MHVGGFSESTQKAREALDFASYACHSNSSLVLSQLPACIHSSGDTRSLTMDDFLNKHEANQQSLIWHVFRLGDMVFS